MGAFTLPESTLPYAIYDVDGNVWKLIESDYVPPAEGGWWTGPLAGQERGCGCYWYADDHAQGVRLLGNINQNVLACRHIVEWDPATAMAPQHIIQGEGVPYYMAPPSAVVDITAWILSPRGIKVTVAGFRLEDIRDVAHEMGLDYVPFEFEKTRQEAEKNPGVAELLGW